MLTGLPAMSGLASDVEDHLAAVPQVLERVDAVVRHPRAAVKAQQGRAALADAVLPDAAASGFAHALTNSRGHHPLYEAEPMVKGFDC